MNKIRLGLVTLLVASFLFAIPAMGAETKAEEFNPNNCTLMWVTAKDGLNIRETPSTERKRVDAVTYGTELYVIGEVENKLGWSSVWYNDEIRYVYNSFLTENKEDIENVIKAKDTSFLSEKEVSVAEYSPSSFQRLGVIYWGGYRWTWYSERVLPGYGLSIPGRYTDNQGYVRDGNGYLCLASNDLAKGTIVDTPFGGQGKIYDCGCASGTLDVYVGW